MDNEHGTALSRALAALFSGTILFVVAPNSVMLRNLGDLAYNPVLVLAFAAAFVAAGALAFAALQRSLPSKHAAGARLAVLPGAVAVAVQIAALWSEQPHIDLAMAIAVDAAAVAAAVALVVLPPLRVVLGVLAIATPVMLGQAVFDHVRQTPWRDPGSLRTIPAAAAGGPALRAGNVYHIILDAFQRELFDKMRAEDPALSLPRFTYYSRFTSGYAITAYSLPHLLVGRPYRAEETFDDWQHLAREGGLWRALHDGGVRLDLYPHWRTYCSSLAGTCASTQQMIREMAGATAERTTIDLWFLGLLPGSARKVMLERVEARRATAVTGAAEQQEARTVEVAPTPARRHTWGADGDHHPLIHAFSITRTLSPATVDRTFAEHEKLASLANADRFLSEEKQRAASGRYVFLHVNIPHVPYVFDPACRLKPAAEQVRPGRVDHALVPAILDQSKCAVVILRRLLDGLADLGRTDDALVIVHSDHGHDSEHGKQLMASFPGLMENEWEGGDEHGYMRSSLTVALRSHSLLLIRMPGSGQFSVSTARVQMTDIAPTILRHYMLPTAGFAGVALQDSMPPDHREVEFHAGVPGVEFFRGGTAPSVIFPMESRFSRFVLERGVWRYRDEVPVH